ncbi:MAG: PHP-associated domain-containing protein [Vicinamibacterales bacterium]
MKLDTHVHTRHSGNTTIRPLRTLMRESYNAPERVYALAKVRGMDLVAITDHDEISGALSLGSGADVVVGCEVTGVFPDDGVRVHLNVFGLTPDTHRETQRLRHDVRSLLPYLSSQGLFVSLNHVASGINGPLTATHVAALLPWVDGLEVRNGSRLASQNRTAMCLAAAAGKAMLGGSDAHTERGIGHTWTEVPGAASAAQFFAGLRAGRGIVGGRHGHQGTMSSDIVRFAANLCIEQGRLAVRPPWSWRRPALVTAAALLGLPLVAVALVGGLVHFVHEQRFNRDLLFDLVARPTETMRRVPELAA